MALEVGDDELKQASLDQRGTDLLIETPEDATTIEERLSQLRARGYRITLTHPERNDEFQSAPDRLDSSHRRRGAAGARRRVALGPSPQPPPAAGRAPDQQRSRPRLGVRRRRRSGRLGAIRTRVGRGRAGRQAASAVAGASTRPRRSWPARSCHRCRMRRPATRAGTPSRQTQNRLPPAAHGSAPASPAAGAAGRSGDRELRDHSFAARLRRNVPHPAAVCPTLHTLQRRPGGPSGAGSEDPQGRGSRPCVPLGIGDLKNPWRCQLSYANGDRLQYTVTISGNGSYVGTNQVILGPGPRQSVGREHQRLLHRDPVRVGATPTRA